MKKLLNAFMVLLLLSCLVDTASAQQGATSRVRTAGTLPATCTAPTAISGANVIIVSGILYVCTATNTWTAGSNPISGLTIGFIPLATASNAIGGNSSCDDGVTTATTVTCSEPVTAAFFTSNGNCNTGTGGCLKLKQGTAPAALDSGYVYIGAPTSVTAYRIILPGAVGSKGLALWNPSGTAATLSSGPQYLKLRCAPGLGDGLNAMLAGTYLQSNCYNDSGVTWTITGVKCYTDNSGTSTLNAAGNTLGALLTGAITCTSSWASGTQSANVLLTAGDYIKFTFVADGTSKQTTWLVSVQQ